MIIYIIFLYSNEIATFDDYILNIWYYYLTILYANE